MSVAAMSVVSLFSPDGASASLVPDHSQPLVAVSLRLSAGSRDDPAGMSGMAHLLEHLMFSRTRRHGRGGHHRLIESAGGYVNAKTSADWTKYVHGIGPDLLAMVLDLEAERCGDTPAMLTEADVDIERKVVVEERAQRMDAVAYGDAVELVVSRLFPTTSGYHRLPVGIPAEVETIGVDDCRRFLADVYVAGRANLSIVGSFEPDQIADKVMGLLTVFNAGALAQSMPTGAPHSAAVPTQAPHSDVVPTQAPRPDAANTPPAAQPGRVEIQGRAKPKIYLGLLLPSEGSIEFELARLAAFYLGRGLASLLPDRLVRGGLASGVSVRTMGRIGGPSIGLVELSPAGTVAPDDLIVAMDAALHDTVQAGPEPAGLQRARAIYRAGRLADDDSLMTRSDAYTLSMQKWGSARDYMRHDETIFAATPRDLHRGLRLWDQPHQRVELIYTR
jgi:zinc protease